MVTRAERGSLTPLWLLEKGSAPLSFVGALLFSSLLLGDDVYIRTSLLLCLLEGGEHFSLLKSQHPELLQTRMSVQ